MTRAGTRFKSAELPQRMQENAFEPPELEEAENPLGMPEDLAEETGLDLSDASLLDADNVLADEEFDRVVQAPD